MASYTYFPPYNSSNYDTIYIFCKYGKIHDFPPQTSLLSEMTI